MIPQVNPIPDQHLFIALLIWSFYTVISYKPTFENKNHGLESSILDYWWIRDTDAGARYWWRGFVRLILNIHYASLIQLLTIKTFDYECHDQLLWIYGWIKTILFRESAIVCHVLLENGSILSIFFPYHDLSSIGQFKKLLFFWLYCAANFNWCRLNYFMPSLIFVSLSMLTSFYPRVIINIVLSIGLCAFLNLFSSDSVLRTGRSQLILYIYFTFHVLSTLAY